MTFDDRLRDALAREGAAVPSRTGDLVTVLKRGKRRKAAGVAAMSLVAVTLVAGSAGFAASLLGDGSGGPPVANPTVVPATGPTTPSTIPDLTATVASTTVPSVTTTTMLMSPTSRVPGTVTGTTLPAVVAGEGCNLLGVGSDGEQQLRVELEAWLVETRPDLASSGGRVALSGRMSAANGWVIVPATFTRAIFEPTMFVRSPSGDWLEVWSGRADAGELIRAQVADAVKEMPPRLLDCADLFTFLEPSQATVLPADLVERAAHGRDIAAGGGFVWVSTGLILEPGVETGEVLKIDTSTGLLVDAIDVTQPMTHLDYAAGVLWISRAGDGALPDNLVGTIDPGSGEVSLTNIGDFSIVSMSADDTGVWLAQGNGWDPAIMRLDRDLNIESLVDLPIEHTIQDMAVVDGVAWLVMSDGGVVRVNPVTGTFLGRTETGVELSAIGVAADRRDPAGRAVWVVGRDGTVVVIRSDGDVHTAYETGTNLCCVVANDASETVWLASWNGAIYFGGLDFGPTLSFAADGSEVHAAVEIGTALWTLGDSLTWILLGQ